MKCTIAALVDADEAEVRTLALSSFMEFIAPTFSPKGVEHVQGNFEPGALLRDNQNGHFCLVAKRDNCVVGMIQARSPGHIAKLYVDKQYHRQGIGRALLDAAIQRLRQQMPDLKELTVNSCRCAVPAYLGLGYSVAEPESEVGGYVITRMTRQLERTEPEVGQVSSEPVPCASPYEPST